MTWRCVLTGHVLGGIVARGDVLHVQCPRCWRLSPGVSLGDPPPARLLTRLARAVVERMRDADPRPRAR